MVLEHCSGICTLRKQKWKKKNSTKMEKRIEKHKNTCLLNNNLLVTASTTKKNNK